MRSEPEITKRINWHAAPAIVTVKPICPHCRSDAGHDRIRTDRRHDGGCSRRCVCRSCGGAYRIVEEFPGPGDFALWPSEPSVG